MLCYVNHHDKAYHWAERRKLETHPKTGAAQIVEVREAVREVVVPVYTPAAAETVNRPKPSTPLFSDCPDDELLGYGVPAEWLNDVKRADEDSLLTLADHLPAEAAEALLELATGGRPTAAVAQVAAIGSGTPPPDTRKHPPMACKPVARPRPFRPFEHPDARRRFRVITSVEELEQALNAPWEKWAIFLHPEQRRWIERDYAGPARVAGSAGTGKTVVAIHRAAYLARKHPEARVLLATFSEPLALLARSEAAALGELRAACFRTNRGVCTRRPWQTPVRGPDRDCSLRHTCSDRTGVDGCRGCCR